MKNILINNAHEPYPFSEGKLNQTLVDMAAAALQDKGYDIQHSAMREEYDVDKEIEKHQWADTIILQTPVNWMGGYPGRLKSTWMRFTQPEWTAGYVTATGEPARPQAKHYGSGGTLVGKQYMISLTYNAPAVAFDNPAQEFFEGKGHDELFWPTHLNFKFFGMTPLKTFACYDVLKNPNVASDFKRFEVHLDAQFPAVTS